MRLLPREEKFFVLFRKQAKLISEASLVLLEGARAGNAQLEAASAKIVRLEQEGDEIIHEVLTKLNQTFITPLDPEDIHNVASHMDDVLDAIEEVSYRMVAYRLPEIPSTIVELCKVIYVSAQELEKAFEALDSDHPLIDHCIEINRQEGIADQLVRRAVSDLFNSEKDPIRLIKLKEVYELLEDTTDRCEDVADVLQNVVVKNS
jgi:predicted phosphate transport protein (TIGR00153 family)